MIRLIAALALGAPGAAFAQVEASPSVRFVVGYMNIVDPALVDAVEAAEADPQRVATALIGRLAAAGTLSEAVGARMTGTIDTGLLCRDDLILFLGDVSDGIWFPDVNDPAAVEIDLALYGADLQALLAGVEGCLTSEDVAAFLNAVLQGDDPIAARLRRAYGVVVTPTTGAE